MHPDFRIPRKAARAELGGAGEDAEVGAALVFALGGDELGFA